MNKRKNRISIERSVLGKVSSYDRVRSKKRERCKYTQIAKFIGLTWGPPESCRPPMGPMFAQWNFLSRWRIYLLSENSLNHGCNTHPDGIGLTNISWPIFNKGLLLRGHIGQSKLPGGTGLNGVATVVVRYVRQVVIWQCHEDPMPWKLFPHHMPFVGEITGDRCFLHTKQMSNNADVFSIFVCLSKLLNGPVTGDLRRRAPQMMSLQLFSG